MIEPSHPWAGLVPRFSSLDFETYQIEAGILAPRIVCGSTAVVGAPGRLLVRDAAVAEAKLLLAGDRVVVGANVAFDMACLAAHDPDLLPLIFRAYAEGRVYDVQVAQALHAIAEGNLYLDPRTGDPLRYVDPETGKTKQSRYSLAACVDLVLGRDDAKDNAFWRRRYAMLENVPLSRWPEEARVYPVDDAENTVAVAVAQVLGGGGGCTPGPHRNADQVADQTETAFALHLGAVWGLRTDRDRVEALRRRTEEAHAKFVEKFRALGFYDAEGKKNLAAVKRAVVLAYGGGDPCPDAGWDGVVDKRAAGLDLDDEPASAKPRGRCVGGKILSPKSGKPVNCPTCSGTGLDTSRAPSTPKGGVRADRDALVESGDVDLAALGDNEPEKVLGTYLPFLEEGVDRPLILRPNPLVASTRTSYDGLIQLMPRDGETRQCIRAREGYYLCSVDYAALELCTFAQVQLWILGRSAMADTINASGDPGALHTAFAAKMRGCTASEFAAALKSDDLSVRSAYKNYRTVAKHCNFGLGGGMGAPKFVLTARKKGAGTTTLPDGTKVPGIRFCVLLDGAERCGLERITEWRGQPTPPVCRRCVELAAELRSMWFEQWPEVRKYFDWVTQRVDEGGDFPFFGTDSSRGGCDFTNGANNGFQSLAAFGAKAALRALVRECYTDRRSAVWGVRPIFFAHDEIVSEVPIVGATAAADRKTEIMLAEMRGWVPDVCVRAEPAIMKFWYKLAEAVRENGELRPWEPS